ncbi:hypothetical protein O181_118246 [Austropuccinia psidii MF-1]|uniref:Uncharacterized protein n=1 Tax=Austropuccinia psidii MF-1 TaxID=1389203 RepID=A0A9Q3KE81_9BASI|nr:hypothetical protein [Austropuccinia psidii MF-1]
MSFKFKSPNLSPILKEDLSVIQSCNPWQLPEDHSRTPTTWPCRSLVVFSLHNHSKGNLKRLSTIQSAFKASSVPVFLEQLNWSKQAVCKQPVWPWNVWDNSYSTVGVPSHS